MSIPKYSQHLDVQDKKWQDRACGIIALKTLIDPLIDKTISADELIQHGLENDAYMEGVGWKHKELSELAEKFGLYGKNFDWANISVQKAWSNTKKYFPEKPVMASVHKSLNPKNNSGHLIVLRGKKDNKIIYHDPDSKNKNNVVRSVDKKRFLRGWKKRIVVISPAPID